MTSPKPLVVDRAQLLKDAEIFEREAKAIRYAMCAYKDDPSAESAYNEDELIAACDERTAQVLRAVAEGVARYRIPGNPFMFTAPASTDSEPVLIIPATISPDGGEEGT